jgi:ABC-type multidrug transport system fused ATPase/permease subunit
MVGYVSQDVFILDGTLALNVALGVEEGDIDHRRVEAVLQQAGLTGFLAKLPDGLESKLGDGGSKVSGGERQRIGIARALYNKASVLFFDEATSSVDAKTEQEINEAIMRLFETQKDLTILVIAHRESTLMFCDRAVEMGQL